MDRPIDVPVRSDNQGANGESISFLPDGNAYCTISEGKQETICVFGLAGTEVR
jgi:hypothetical protein